jgi:hypothetical protein
MLHDVPRTATVQADTDARLHALERDDFLAVVTGNSPAQTEARTVAAARLEENAAAAERRAVRGSKLRPCEYELHAVVIDVPGGPVAARLVAR